MTPQVAIPCLRLGLSEGIAHWSTYRGLDLALAIDGAQTTFSQLEHEVSAIHEALMEAVPRNARIAISVRSKVQFVASIVAAIRHGGTGVICVPTWSDEQMRDTLSQHNVAGIIHDGDVRRFAGDRPVVKVPLKGVAVTSRPPMSRRLVTSEWAVLFSSGTTGRPKGIIRTDLSILSELIGWCIELTLSSSTRFYIGRPLFYTGGLVLAAATLMAGGSVLSSDDDSVGSFLKVCAEKMPTCAFLVPQQLKELMRIASEGSLEGLKILTMGDFIDPGLKVELSRRLRCSIIESWGNSEGLGTITSEADLLTRPASIGRPFLGDSLMIADEGGIQKTRGQRGRIVGSADSCLSYYEGRDDLTRCVMKDELVISEDVGYQDADGYFYLLGRASDFVVRNGISVNLRNIESRANKLLGVNAARAAVLDQDHGGEPRLVIAVELASGHLLKEEELKDEINRGANEGETIDRVVILAGFTRNAAGKIVVENMRGILERERHG